MQLLILEPLRLIRVDVQPFAPSRPSRRAKHMNFSTPPSVESWSDRHLRPLPGAVGPQNRGREVEKPTTCWTRGAQCVRFPALPPWVGVRLNPVWEISAQRSGYWTFRSFYQPKDDNMSEQHASRREFVTGVGLGIAGLSLAGEARAGGLFGRLRGRRRRNTSCDWEFIKPILYEPKKDAAGNVISPVSPDFGFLVPHPFWSGVPIPGFPEVLGSTAPDPSMAPASLEIKNAHINRCQRWTGGNFGIYITRTPTLFHALHFKSNPPVPNAEQPFGIEPRYEERVDKNGIRHGNITETDFMVKDKQRYPLQGVASKAGQKLFDVKFDERGFSPTMKPVARSIPFDSLDSKAMVAKSIEDGYFDTIDSVWEKHLDYVGPLNAVWLFILAHNDGVKAPSLAIARLGRGHRFWHVRADHDNPAIRDGYEMDAFRCVDNTGKDKFKRIRYEIELSGALNKGRKECPDEKVALSFEMEWS